MASKFEEIELKLRVPGVDEILDLLKRDGIKEVDFFDQTDVLYDIKEEGKSFGDVDHALRLRVEKGKNKTTSILTFKGTASYDEKGFKTRPEFNTKVDDYKATEGILDGIGFYPAVTISKHRHIFDYKDIDIILDEAKYGNFLELEGEKDKINKFVDKLGLSIYPVETRGHVDLLHEWEKSN